MIMALQYLQVGRKFGENLVHTPRKSQDKHDIVLLIIIFKNNSPGIYMYMYITVSNHTQGDWLVCD